MKPTDRAMARQSLQEENKAIQDYGDRGAATSHPPLRKALGHARGDEREHAASFRRVLRGGGR